MSVQFTLDVCIAGSSDFVRRLTATLKRPTSEEHSFTIRSRPTNLAEMRSVLLTERPHVLAVEIGHRATRRDLLWLHGLLSDMRERFGKKLYVLLAITSPERFVYGGSLLFANEHSLEPSGLIDNLMITPPPGIPSIPSLESQFLNCIEFVGDLRVNMEGEEFPLPGLWSKDWVPVMCDPESRNVWMRWLPRYARYINENPIIVGPTGSGKTRLAAAIHSLSGREGPFISITPRDFSSSELVQAELFGAVAGAYTGAVDKWGLVKKAEKGTLFIDELQSIDRDLQGKLITFIENKSYRRVGEAESNYADVRFVFATNRSLQDLVQDGSLRDDFAYRLERLQIALSPLHTRRLDISAAICFALAKVLRERAQARAAYLKKSQSVGLGILEGLTPEAYKILFCSTWPGNLRQLENTVAKLIELADVRGIPLIDSDCTGRTLQGLLGQTELSSADVFEKAAISVALRARTEGFDGLNDCLFGLSEQARYEALDFCGGDIDEASELIGDSEKAMRLFVASRTRL